MLALSTGFCSICNYEFALPETTVQALREAAGEWFATTQRHKNRSWVDGVVGYIAEGDETVAASEGTGVQV